jgi:O-antigen ligase
VTATALLAALLFYAALTLWVPGRWAWSLFQVGVFLLAVWRVGRARGFRLTPAAATLAAAALWPLAQVAAGSSVDGGETWMAALNWATFLVVFLVAADILSGRRERHWFLGAISLGGMTVAAAAVLQDYSSAGKIFWLFPSGYHEDVLGPFVNRNQYAAWVELLLPVALYLAVTARRRALYGTAAAVLLGSVIAGASRAGSALAVGEVFAVALALAARHANPRRAVAMWAAQFACFAAIAIAVVGWQSLRDRLGAPGTESLRVDAVRASLAMIHDRPWMGSGLGTWARMYPRYAGLDTGMVVNQAHNDWAQWAAEGGLPFLMVMILFAGLLCKPAFRSIYGLGVAAVLLHALVDYPMQQRPALAAWWFAMAGAAWARGAAANGAYDDVLRRTGRSRRGIARGDPAGLQTAGPAAPSGSLCRPGHTRAGRVADAAAQRNSGSAEPPGRARELRPLADGGRPGLAGSGDGP